MPSARTHVAHRGHILARRIAVGGGVCRVGRRYQYGVVARMDLRHAVAMAAIGSATDARMRAASAAPRSLARKLLVLGGDDARRLPLATGLSAACAPVRAKMGVFIGLPRSMDSSRGVGGTPGHASSSQTECAASALVARRNGSWLGPYPGKGLNDLMRRSFR